MNVSEAPGAVREIVALAGDLLRDGPGQDLPSIPASELALRVNRVARLRNELHVTANRVAEFSYEEHPRLDAVRITASTASVPALVAPRVLVQLDLTAARLIKYLDALSATDWKRTGRAGDELVTLGELVDDVVHTARHDLLDLMHAAPSCPQRKSHDAVAS